MKPQDYTSFGPSEVWWSEESESIRLQSSKEFTKRDKASSLWPSEAAQLGRWLIENASREHPFYIYYRTSNKDHIVQDGDTLCSHNVRIPRPESDRLKPFSKVTDKEWSLILSVKYGFCSQCYGIAGRKDIWPEKDSDDPPSFSCPKCGDSAESIISKGDIEIVEHSDGRSHEVQRHVFERWRRGETGF
jgi:hypothetical protein